MKKKSVLMIAAVLGMNFSTSAQDLLKNANFANWMEGKPAEWNLTNNKQKVFESKPDGLEGVNKVLTVEIITDGGNSLGEIRQNITVTPNTNYKFSGWLKSSQADIGLFMIKLRSGREELERIVIGKSTPDWQQVGKTINTGKADNIQVLCRYKQKAEIIGTICFFGNLKLVKE
jgi:hypothetical protein